MKFDEFFRHATGDVPFPYQVRLAVDPELPDLLCVPTGAGKTAAAVLGWLWRRRFATNAVRRATPRRLVFCLPMRTLVDQTAASANRWIKRLGLTDEIRVHRLLGGAVDESWESDPERDAILVGTQDQLLSRALNRGYAMSRYRWPIHFALLNNDCLWVMDEVQLMGVGLSTSTQLQAFRDSFGTAAGAQSVWMSATLDRARLDTVDFRGRTLRCLELDEADRDSPGLAARLVAKKPLSRATASHDSPRGVAAEVLRAHVSGSLTLVVVNRVGRAQAIHEELARTPGVPLALIHSRFRPADRRLQHQALERAWTGIIVATQALEAGVDVSARTLFTELAPWPSLVQRFGRCNRRGEFGADAATIAWIDVPDADATPYAAADLSAARELVSSLDDVGTERVAAIANKPEPPTAPVLRRRDLVELFDTQPDLAGHDIDVSGFIRATDDRDVQVAWRRWGGEDPPSDMPEPHRDELCSVPIGALLKLAKGSKAYRWAGLEGTWVRVRRFVPGMVVVLPVDAGGYHARLGWTGDAKHVPEPISVATSAADADDSERLSFCCAEYVSLAVHSADVAAQARRLRDSIGGDQPWLEVETASRWHDLGKTHPCFQEMLLKGLGDGDPRRGSGPWAKSDGAHSSRNQRRHFRHELASALAWIDKGGDALTAYLIAAHHGKVRLSVRPRPTETPAPNGARFALGIWDGEVLPASDLGDGVSTRATTLRLDLVQLGESAAGSSWLDRMLGLLEEHGPFRLAYWETLVRIADWRGTRLRMGAGVSAGDS